jgi:hypothetical protein
VADPFSSSPPDPDEWLRETRRRDAVDARRDRIDERLVRSDEATLTSLCESARIDASPVTVTSSTRTRSGVFVQVSPHLVVLAVAGRLAMTPMGRLSAVASSRMLKPVEAVVDGITVRGWLDAASLDRPEVSATAGGETVVGILEWVGADLCALRTRRGDGWTWTYLSLQSLDEVTMASG